MNTMKQKLKTGETVFGQMILELFTPGVAAILDNAGLDFVIYDMEHGRCGYELLSQMVTSCRGTRLTAIARVPDLYAQPLARLLDIGAQGVMIPRLQTAAQMQDAIAQLKYPPCGRRGVALGLAHDNFRPRGAGYFEEANQETVVIAIIETPQAIENLEAIVSTPGLDVAWMGHYDLTVSLGIPAQFEHPVFLDAMQALVTTCRKHGVAAGFLPATVAEKAYWLGQGFRAISLGTDVGVYAGAVSRFLQGVNESAG